MLTIDQEIPVAEHRRDLHSEQVLQQLQRHPDHRAGSPAGTPVHILDFPAGPPNAGKGCQNGSAAGGGEGPQPHGWNRNADPPFELGGRHEAAPIGTEGFAREGAAATDCEAPGLGEAGAGRTEDGAQPQMAGGNGDAAVGSEGVALLQTGTFWWCVAGVAVTGSLNLAVSFFLAFRVALRSRGIRLSDRSRIYGAIRRRLRRRPASFVLPPR